MGEDELEGHLVHQVRYGHTAVMEINGKGWRVEGVEREKGRIKREKVHKMTTNILKQWLDYNFTLHSILK